MCFTSFCILEKKIQILIYPQSRTEIIIKEYTYLELLSNTIYLSVFCLYLQDVDVVFECMVPSDLETKIAF